MPCQSLFRCASMKCCGLCLVHTCMLACKFRVSSRVKYRSDTRSKVRSCVRAYTHAQTHTLIPTNTHAAFSWQGGCIARPGGCALSGHVQRWHGLRMGPQPLRSVHTNPLPGLSRLVVPGPFCCPTTLRLGYPRTCLQKSQSLI